MIYSINNECCAPILALDPFVSTTINVGEQGRTGLSGPNVELIAFNSGDFNFATTNVAAVGLGVAVIPTTATIFSELGVVILHQCTLRNFEIAFSGTGVQGSNGSMTYVLVVSKSASNSGVDYDVPGFVPVFNGIFNINQAPSGPISSNKLIITPIGNNIVSPGDRIVLLVVKDNVAAGSLEVSASIQCFPS